MVTLTLYVHHPRNPRYRERYRDISLGTSRCRIGEIVLSDGKHGVDPGVELGVVVAVGREGYTPVVHVLARP